MVWKISERGAGTGTGDVVLDMQHSAIALLIVPAV